jgi:hypothetical protein
MLSYALLYFHANIMTCPKRNVALVLQVYCSQLRDFISSFTFFVSCIWGVGSNLFGIGSHPFCVPVIGDPSKKEPDAAGEIGPEQAMNRTSGRSGKAHQISQSMEAKSRSL